MSLSLRFTGAEVLRPDGWDDGPLSIAGGVIDLGTDAARTVDLSGYRVLPGIVDIHGDGFERHMAPRRGALRTSADGIVSTERELAANGITTAMLAQFWSWEGGMRGPEFARHMAESLAAAGPGLATDMRLQLRVETHMLDSFDDALALIDEFAIPYVVFNDHLPHDRLAAGRQPKRLTGQALKSGRSPEAHLRIMAELHNRSGDVPLALDRLAAALRERGVILGSHDDDTPEARAAWRVRQVTLAEFPLTRAVAEAGDPVILGAPNVMRGGSHEGNVSALDLVEAGLCDALASDYHYPALHLAALKIADRGLLDLASAWSLISARPARLLNLTDRGALAPGQRADLTILDRDNRIAATLSNGTITHLSGDIGSRLFAG